MLLEDVGRMSVQYVGHSPLPVEVFLNANQREWQIVAPGLRLYAEIHVYVWASVSIPRL